MQELIFALAYDVVPQPVCCRCIRTVHKETRALEVRVTLSVCLSIGMCECVFNCLYFINECPCSSTACMIILRCACMPRGHLHDNIYPHTPLFLPGIDDNDERFFYDIQSRRGLELMYITLLWQYRWWCSSDNPRTIPETPVVYSHLLTRYISAHTQVGEKARNLAELEIMESEMLTRNRPDLSRMHKRLLDRQCPDLLPV